MLLWWDIWRLCKGINTIVKKPTVYIFNGAAKLQLHFYNFTAELSHIHYAQETDTWYNFWSTFEVLILFEFFCSATPNTCLGKILKQASVRITVIQEKKWAVAWNRLVQNWINIFPSDWKIQAHFLTVYPHFEIYPQSDKHGYQGVHSASTAWLGDGRQLMLCTCSGLFVKWIQLWYLFRWVSWWGLNKIRVNGKCSEVMIIEWLLINSDDDSQQLNYMTTLHSPLKPE